MKSRHHIRCDRQTFDGTTESEITGIEIYYRVCDIANVFGKANTRRRIINVDGIKWQKVSILFNLSYWKYMLLHHNLNLMHIEKSVCDNVVKLLLEIYGETNDNQNACKH